MSELAALSKEFSDWLDSQDFYEICQRYRWAKPPSETVDAFESLKDEVAAKAWKAYRNAMLAERDK